jgi:hypothetical protein
MSRHEPREDGHKSREQDRIGRGGWDGPAGVISDWQDYAQRHAPGPRERKEGGR